MNVLLNIECCCSPVTGVGWYTIHLRNGLLRRSDVQKVSLWSGRRLVAAEATTASAPQTSGRAGLLRRVVRNVPLARQVRMQYFRLAFRRMGERLPAGTVYHETNHVLLPYDGPAVVTVHDLSVFRYPQYHPRQRVKFFQEHIPRSLRRADHVLTVSQFVRREIIETFGLDPAKVSAIHLGVDEAFRPQNPCRTRPVLDRHGLAHGRYLLSVGTMEPRKNFAGLLAAYGRLDGKLQSAFPLVLAGAQGWHSRALQRQVAAIEARGLVRSLGYVPADELPALYAGAGAFAYPSFYEGFGLPVLEAMACGVPVLTSAGTSMEEFAGDATMLVNPADENAIRAGLERMLADQAWRQEASQKGLLRAGQFTWDRFVDRTVEVYRQVACRAR